MSGEKDGTLEYKVQDISGFRKFDVYVDGDLVAEKGSIVEIRNSPVEEDEE